MFAERVEDVASVKVRIPSATRSAAYRIPDVLTDEALIEIKNVKRQRFTRQLQDFLHYCRETDRQFVLCVRPDTILARAITEMQEAGALSIRHLHPSFTIDGQRRWREATSRIWMPVLDKLLLDANRPDADNGATLSCSET